MKVRFFFGSLFLLSLVQSGCESVRPYQRVYLNDEQMKMGRPGAHTYEQNMQSYREGASGGGSSKVSGGCGCN
jgi:TorA maturation chaperone TorD